MPIRLQFHGASRSVTGSCFALDNGRCRILIDCGMFQGSKTEKELNYRDFPFVPRDIHAMLLTHAHIDHSGLIPKLVKHGFQGPILATGATVDLCSVMLPDSGHIQEVEVDQLNRRNARRGLPHVTPIYTAEDATAAMTQFRPVTLGAWAQAGPGIRARYWNAGHLLGSASIEVEVQDDERPPVRVLFSGDIGPDDKLLEHAPEGPSGVDYVLCESTYGDTDRLETNFTRRRALLRAELEAAKRRDGALLIPSFAVERTQELLVDIVALMQAGSVPQAPIFIDSPLASRASAIFARHAREIPAGDDLTRALAMPNVRVTESVEQSKAIGRLSGFHIIIAASGMCEAGRIRHHLRGWLSRANATVLMVGYQAQGTLGRILQEGAARVRLMGEDVQVRATIRTLDVYSGHADAPELDRWLRARLPIAQGLFLTHGEEEAMQALRASAAAFVRADRIFTPALDDAFELTPTGAHAIAAVGPRRVAAEHLGHRDWHNELSKLLVDVNEQLDRAADERGKAVIIRRLRRALEDATA